MLHSGNLFAALPASREDNELFELLAGRADTGVRIERIVSQGHVTPENDWYDQNQHEWVVVLQGEALLAIENHEELHLKAGDYINIPAHVRHRVAWTHPDQQTVWLAIFY